MPLNPGFPSGGLDFNRDTLNCLGGLLAWAQEELSILGPDEAKASAERLLSDLTGMDRTSLYLGQNNTVSALLSEKYQQNVFKRKQRVPVAYILGQTYFWNELLKVDSRCLIPRPETEILVERFIENSGFSRNDRFIFLDLGSGSGAIGIALLRHYKYARAVFSDISEGALEITSVNLRNYGLEPRSRLVCSDVFSAFEGEKWDAVISNPPYIAAAEWEGLEPELMYEPRTALYGGNDGLDFYRRIIAETESHLTPGGVLALEIGSGQAEPVAQMLASAFNSVLGFKDYSELDRVFIAKS